MGLYREIYSDMSNLPYSKTINHPSYYTYGDIEVIDVIEDWELPYHLGNAVKYIGRAGKKDDIKEDIQKAIWYLERYYGTLT